MKNLYLIIAALITAQAANAQDFYLQKQNEVEFKRLNQSIAQMKKDNEQQANYIREIEKQNSELKKLVEETNKRVDSLLDLWVNFENVSLPNLIESDKTLANRINDVNNHIKEQTPLWNWGELARECPKVGKHQQVRTITTEDGSASVQYLCFDGRILHLNTTSNIPPVE